MKPTYIICYLLLLASCNSNRRCYIEYSNKYVVVKPKEVNYFTSHNFDLKELNCEDFSVIDVLTQEQEELLKVLMIDTSFHSFFDPASCTIDRCIIHVDSHGEVAEKIFLGCAGNVLLVYSRDTITKIGISEEKGIPVLLKIVTK